MSVPYITHANYDPHNCYSWAKYRVPTIDPMWYMMQNAKMVIPNKGDLAMFYYEKSGLPHVAVVEYVFHNGGVLISEANMYHLYEDGVGTRYIPPQYHHLVGFYEPRQTHQAQ